MISFPNSTELLQVAVAPTPIPALFEFEKLTPTSPCRLAENRDTYKAERVRLKTHITCNVCKEKMFLAPTYYKGGMTMVKCTCGHYDVMPHIIFRTIERA